jgi:hypothetical protein
MNVRTILPVAAVAVVLASAGLADNYDLAENRHIFPQFSCAASVSCGRPIKGIATSDINRFGPNG